MLRFLFSFCGAKADATEIEPRDRNVLAAYEKVRTLANEKTSLKDDFDSAWVEFPLSIIL